MNQPDASSWASGSCACGEIRYELRLADRVALCHCDTCRRASGAAGLPWANGERQSLRLHGEPARWRSSGHAERWFCRNCGGQLFCLEDDAAGIIEVAVGTLFDATPVHTVSRSFAHRRPAWDQQTVGYAHVQLGANDLPALVRFYDRLLPVLGWQRQGDPEPPGPAGVVWTRPGQRWPQFVIGQPFDGRRASAANGSQVSFLVSSQAMVQALWQLALDGGAQDEGAPALRPQYADDFFAAYCRDPEGHKLCLVHTLHTEPQL